MSTKLATLDPASENASGGAAPILWFGAIICCCVVTLVAMAWTLGVGLVDDSYIFLRYARNFAQGNGAVFNVGERVEGFSSPLWTLMLGTAGMMLPRFETLAYVLGLACGIGIVIVLLFGVRRWAPSLGRGELFVLGMGTATCPILVFWSASGMDTALFVLLITAALVSLTRDSEKTGLSKRTTLLLILATLARMEAVLLVGLAAFVFAAQRRSVRALWGYGLSVGALLLIRYSYYGSWVPNTYHAKVTFGLAQRLSNGLSYGWPALWANVLLVAALACAVLLVGRRRSARTAPTVWLAAGWVVVWCAYVVYVGGDNFALFRFLLPLIPALFLLAAMGWSSVRVRLSARRRYAVLVGVALILGISHVRTFLAQAEGYYGDAKLAQSWKTVGEWLERETPPDTVIATIVPGALGYFGCRPTIDMLGLTDGRVSREGQVFAGGGHGHARYHTDYIFERSPDLVLYHSSGRFRQPVYADPKNIPVWSGFALFDFVTDPRCAGQYRYTTARLENGKLIEMLEKRNQLSVVDVDDEG